jgi:hypothetical protein
MWDTSKLIVIRSLLPHLHDSSENLTQNNRFPYREFDTTLPRYSAQLLPTRL